MSSLIAIFYYLEEVRINIYGELTIVLTIFMHEKLLSKAPAKSLSGINLFFLDFIFLEDVFK